MCCGNKPIKNLLEKTTDDQTARDLKTQLPINVTDGIGPFFCEDALAPNQGPSECPLRVNRCLDQTWYRIMTEQCPR